MFQQNKNYHIFSPGVLAVNGTGKVTNPLFGPSLRDILDKENGGVEFLKRFIPSLVGLILIVGVIVFVFVMLVGAIQWIASGGDKASVENARGRITNALIGLVILFSVFAIILLIEKFFGLNILTLDIGVLRIR